jgi:hypothetical protein
MSELFLLSKREEQPGLSGDFLTSDMWGLAWNMRLRVNGPGLMK